jgi:hypothetical protein
MQSIFTNNSVKFFIYLLVVWALLIPTRVFAFGANEIKFCQESTTSIDISTYTDELQNYMTERTGVVPGWLVGKSVNKIAKKNKQIDGISGAASEIYDWCTIAAEDDEVIRATKALAKLAEKAGPVGAVVGAQMSVGIETLQVGMKYISSTNRIRLASDAKWNFCLQIYSPVWWRTDPLKDRAEVLAEVSGVTMFTTINGIQTPVPSELNVNINDKNQSNLACYQTTFEYADYAEAAYAIRVDFFNGQRVYASTTGLVAPSGNSSTSLKLNSSLIEQGAVIYSLR